MSKWEKLLRRILNLSNDIRFEELRKVLEEYGYAMHAPKGGSSHCSFRKKGYPTITVPRHDPIKRVYVEMVRKVVEEAEEHENLG